MSDISRALPGSRVTVVIAINRDLDTERTQVFSTPETAQAWADTHDDSWTCIIVEPMVVDVPEFGNELQEKRS